ncbi:hypothetical protein IPN35_04025 [Candidatus Peregrinibacteria bacterium]|nr:MAG: hypothetical protein IPN35_04025 [Candidatus Peregrinibacteria bacterium]
MDNMTSNINFLGNYLDKDVFYESNELLLNLFIKKSIFHNSMILFYFEKYSENDKSYLQKILSDVIMSNPVGIWIAGEYSDLVFENLLFLLSILDSPEKDQVITGTIESENTKEVIENFFFTAIPDEFRWDNWKRYLIIGIGSTKFKNNMTKEIQSFIIRDP